jgi:serine/threonine-protein kinase
MSDRFPSTEPPPDPLVGTVVAERYHVEKKLGEGGMGAVYLARHVVLEKQVALKILHGEFSHRPDLVERFLHEAKAAARIRHEHVIDISDFGQTATGNPFFCMELLSGTDLANEVRKGVLLPWPRIKSIVLQTCSALQAAHDAGIVHRDLKPENMFLIERLGHPDFVKVLDFGIAKLTELEESGRRLTRTGMVFGTPEYMSPEQARGDKTDHRVDVYAMGCILYQLVTGDVPFRAETFMGVLTRHLFEEVPPFASRVQRPDLPAGLEAVVMRALDKDRDKRWGSMHELAVAVDQLDVIPGVAYYAPGASTPTTSTGQVAALQTPAPRTPPGGVPHPTAAQASAPTRLEIAGTGATGAQKAIGAAAGAAAAPTVVQPATAAATPARAAGTPAPAAPAGEGPTMADLAGQRFTAPPRGKSRTGLVVGAIVVAAGLGVGAVFALGGGKGGGNPAPGVTAAADAGAPVLEEAQPDAATTAAAAGDRPDAGAPDAGAATAGDGRKKPPKPPRPPSNRPDAGPLKNPFETGGGGGTGSP